jgi:two-component system, chemotaxis family, protein-glutamate methylesterase/glutaminase
VGVATEEDFRVVCLCGSAGGLASYIGFLRHMPADSGMGFVVASHRRDSGVTFLLGILAGVTDMPVIEVKDGMILEPNHVYLLPAGRQMTVVNKKFGIQPLDKPYGWPTTISLFLGSVVETYG